MKRIVLMLLCLLSAAGHAALENFDTATWAHHEPLAAQVLTDDLVISVDTGASMKGVINPNALQPGFDRARPTQKLVIEPRNKPYVDLFSLNGTDVFQMPEPQLKVEGFREGVVVASRTMGPLWDEANKNGVTTTFPSFRGLERIEISSDVTDLADSDVFFFLESVGYEVTDTITPAPTPAPTPTKSDDNGSSLFGGLWFGLLAVMGCLAWRRRMSYSPTRSANFRYEGIQEE